MQQALADGRKQVQSYGRSLDARYGNLRLQKFVVAAVGFERVVWEKEEG